MSSKVGEYWRRDADGLSARRLDLAWSTAWPPSWPWRLGLLWVFVWPSSRQLDSLMSTSYFLAAFMMRFQAASFSLSVMPSTWSNRATAFRKCLASVSGSLCSFVNANTLSGSLSFCAVLRPSLCFRNLGAVGSGALEPPGFLYVLLRGFLLLVVVDTDAPLQAGCGLFAVALPEIGADGIQGWGQQQPSSPCGRLRSAAATDRRQSTGNLIGRRYAMLL